VYVYRDLSSRRPTPNGIALTAADPELAATIGATLAHGTFLNAATARYPAVVLGAESASVHGITNLVHPADMWIGGHWFTVAGILNPVRLISQMDSMAFIGFPIAEQYCGFDGHPTQLYVRSVYTQVSAVAAVLPYTVNPEDPPPWESATRPTSCRPRWPPRAPTTACSSAPRPPLPVPSLTLPTHDAEHATA
jgi:putative ABC transport system permease protein